jgi:hypothetical protein
MGDKYFVRSSTDGPEKGPYEIDALQKSFDRGLLKSDAMARLDGGEKWVSLKELLAPEIAKGVKRRSAEDEADFARARARDFEIENQRRSGSANLGIGLAMVAAGIVLTLISTSKAGGGGIIFVGLIVFGIVRIIRGASA